MLEACVPDLSGVRCTNHKHGGRIATRGPGDVLCCRWYLSQLSTAKQCVGCQGMVPQGEIWRMNPRLVAAYTAGQTEKPKLGHQFAKTLGGIPGSDNALCETCAVTAQSAVNVGTTYPGRIKLKDSHRTLPMFLSPTVQREAERRGESDGGIRQVAKAIVNGESVKYSKRHPGGQNSCVILANSPDACICGGWHSWADMPATIRYKREQPQIFAFGPACADRVRDLVEFSGTFQELMEETWGAKRRPAHDTATDPEDDADDWSNLRRLPLASEANLRPAAPRRRQPPPQPEEVTDTRTPSEAQLDEYAEGTSVKRLDPHVRDKTRSPKPKPLPRTGKTSRDAAKKRRRSATDKKPSEASETSSKLSKNERKAAAAAK